MRRTNYRHKCVGAGVLDSPTLSPDDTFVIRTTKSRGEQRSPAFVRLHGMYKFKPRRSPNGTSGAPSPTFGDLPIHGCEAERATQGRPYAKVLLSQNRFARCFLCFALASFSVRLCHSSFLTPHLAPLFALFTIICYNKNNCDKIRKDL